MLTLSWTKRFLGKVSLGNLEAKLGRLTYPRTFWEACFYCCECESPKGGIVLCSSFILFPSVYFRERQVYTIHFYILSYYGGAYLEESQVVMLLCHTCSFSLAVYNFLRNFFSGPPSLLST